MNETPEAKVAPAPTGDQFSTQEHFNGRLWVSATETEKIMYFVGARSALHAIPSKEADQLLPHLAPAEVCAALDRFYADSVNLPVPVIFALAVVTLRAEGSDPAFVEKVAAGLRKDANEPETAPVKP